MADLKGHWRLDVYEGDLRYGPLPLQKRLANVVWATEAALPSALRYQRVHRGLRRHRHRGEILNRRLRVIEGDNLVTTSGKGQLLDRWFGLGSVGAVTQMGVGTSATAAAVGDTTLTGTVLQTYDALPTRSGLVVTAISTYGTGTANITWQELASFNATPTMANRIAPIGPFTKSSAVSIVVTQTMTQA